MTIKDGSGQDWPIAEVDYDEAKELADYVLIAQDLDFTVHAIERLQAYFNEESEDHIIMRSLYGSALMSYNRCFTTGKRVRLDESIYRQLSGDAIGCHQLYKNLRDKFVAHSVNPFEECKVGIILTPEGSEKEEVSGVMSFAKSFITPTAEALETFRRLVVFAKQHVSKIEENHREKTLQAAKADSIEKLYKMSRPRLTGNDPEQAAIPRK